MEVVVLDSALVPGVEPPGVDAEVGMVVVVLGGAP
jgi:hypothetical protein